MLSSATFSATFRERGWSCRPMPSNKMPANDKPFLDESPKRAPRVDSTNRRCLVLGGLWTSVLHRAFRVVSAWTSYSCHLLAPAIFCYFP